LYANLWALQQEKRSELEMAGDKPSELPN
jgi:hypothetical protein